MTGTQLDTFLDAVRTLVDRSHTALVDLDEVDESGRKLLETPTIETIAAARAELYSATRILQRRGLPIDTLTELEEELGASLLTEATAEARRDDREYSSSLGERILGELAHEQLSPSKLAARLGVEISQISRAARVLRDDGRILVEQVTQGDRRRRTYKAVQHKTATGRRWSWKVFVERLPSLRVDDVRSDLLPGRVGDNLSRAKMATVCAAFRRDLEAGRYTPTPTHEVEVPKTGGGTRPAAALRFADRLAYAALVERCRPEIEANLASTSAVLWPRGFASKKQWVKLEGFVNDSNQTHVLSVDIQSFYDSIHHDVLADALLRAGCDDIVVSALKNWLGEIMEGRKSGLPQGLEGSDPLATAVLAPLDDALTAEGVSFRRHGDDLRVLGSFEEVQDAERLVRRVLRSLELPINDDKTRTLRHDTYMHRRTEISRAAREYLEAKNLYERNSAVFTLLEALGADEELLWSWYHDTLSVDEVLLSLGSLEPTDTAALMHVLQGVEETDRSRPGVLLMRAEICLLTAAGVAGPARQLRAPIVARAEYADVLSTYIEATASVDPAAVAGLLQRIEDTGVTYSAQWLRLYAALGDAGKSGEFDELAQTHVEADDDSWVRRLRAARFMACRGKLDAAYLPEISEQAPPALRDDVLDIVAHAAPQRLGEFTREDGETAAALVGAAV